MKKGLTIALLMVALVALAASASAVAPVIGNLPAVIIGDAGDVSGVATDANSLHLLRYVNVFNLADPGIIDRKNSTDLTKLRVFYQSSQASLKASNKYSLIAGLTNAEVAALTGDAGTTTAAKNITPDASATWLSLIQNPSSAGAVPQSAWNAAASVHGSKVSDLINVDGVLTTAGLGANPITSGPLQTITLFAADGATTTSNGAGGVTNLVGRGSFVVYQVIATDDNYSPIDRVYTANVANAAATGEVDKWNYANLSAAYGGPLQAGIKVTTAAGIGFRGVAAFDAGKNQCFSRWQHMKDGAANFTDYVLAPAKNMDGKIYRATIKLTGDATDPMLCPAFRFLYSSLAFSHVGGFQVNTPPGGDGIPQVAQGNMPSLANPEVELQMLWAVPSDMLGYSDTGILTTAATGVDFRDYYIFFDLMQSEAGDVGSLVMKSMAVDRIVRPASALSAVQYGTVTRNFTTTTGNKFDGTSTGDTAGPWLKGATDLGTGDGLGTVNITPSMVSLSMSTTNPNATSVFQQVAANPAQSAFPTWTSRKLIRTTYNLACTNGAGCPQIRALVIPYVRPFYSIGNVIWADLLNPFALAVGNRYQPSKYAYLAGSPKTTGSTFESYAYTQSGIEPLVDPSTMSSALTTALDINVQQGSYNVAQNNGWTQKPNARLIALT